MMEDRRREQRFSATGLVEIKLPDGTVLHATLLDKSESGFRAEYSGASVSSGTRVTVMTDTGQFEARVAWTVTHAGQSQSGFYKL